MKLFFSYASIDQIEYKVEQIVEFLEFQDDIEDVFYWERDTRGGQTFDDYMRTNIQISDLIIILFTENTIESVPVIQEIGIAKAFEKKLMPIFVDIEDIFANINSSRGIRYEEDFREFCEDLYYKITKKKAKFKEENPLMDLRNDMHENFQFNKLNYVEPEFKAISKIYNNHQTEEEDDNPLVSYRIFNFILFDPLNRGSLNIVTAPPHSGKSVLLESLKYDILHREQLISYIPYLINARDIETDDEEFQNILYDYLLPNTERKYVSYLERNLKDGKGILLIDGLNGNSSPKELLSKLYDFTHLYNARTTITCLPVIHKYIKNLALDEERYEIYELNTFKPASLFEWIVLNKNSFDQTRDYQAKDIYLALKKRLQEKEEKGEKVLLPLLMQDFTI